MLLINENEMKIKLKLDFGNKCNNYFSYKLT